MGNDSSCRLCKVYLNGIKTINSEIIYGEGINFNPNFYAILNPTTDKPGHALLISKNHFVDRQDMANQLGFSYSSYDSNNPFDSAMHEEKVAILQLEQILLDTDLIELITKQLHLPGPPIKKKNFLEMIEGNDIKKPIKKFSRYIKPFEQQTYAHLHWHIKPIR